MLGHAILLVLGLLALVAGAEALVRGASKIALSLGVSSLVVGLTIVAFGTSAPEVAASVGAVLNGSMDIAVGNVVGSNIFNALVTLGVSALIVQPVVHSQLIRQEVPIMIGASLLLLVVVLDGTLGRADAGLLLALLVLGSNWLVDASVVFARALGVSDLVIGLTIIAAGTSMPEVATSIMAAIRGERDIAVGNVIGSNTFNILGCLGISGLVGGQGLAIAPAVMNFDIWVMIAVAIACLPVFVAGREIGRGKGLLFLAYYVAYVAYPVLDARGHDLLPKFSAIMLGFVLPITIVTLVAVLVRNQSKNPPTDAG
jgi:cation:H+ antiporter